MTEKFEIAGYGRISVDVEADRDNTSIENQRAIIEEFVARKFPGSSLTFFSDRDRSGYTFEQREGYQDMRRGLMSHKFDVLIVKDFSRFSRRNSRGLVELEDLRDAGVRIISIGDNIDCETIDDWMEIQFRFLINEMPVTDTSKKVKSVIKQRQSDGKWICAVPFGYLLTNSKTMTFEVDGSAAEVVRMIFDLYNGGWGYQKIANHLTSLHIPTPRMVEAERKEQKGEESRRKTRPEWSIITVQGILENDFYIGTLRQGKYRRKKINGSDLKLDSDEHIVFEKHHEPIVDYRVFAAAQEQRKKRKTTNYRGVRINENVYSGYLFCGDCGSPMFSMSRRDLRPAYTCGTYHRHGLSGCTSHHTRVDVLDTLLKSYLLRVRDGAQGMMAQLEESIKNERSELQKSDNSVDALQAQLLAAHDELKATKRQKIREIMRRPEREEELEETYAELERELEHKLEGLQNQISLTADRRNLIIRSNRVAKTAIEIFDEILAKDKLDKSDLEVLIERITVYEDHLDIRLKSDIDELLRCGTGAGNADAKCAPAHGELVTVGATVSRPQSEAAANVELEADRVRLQSSDTANENVEATCGRPSEEPANFNSGIVNIANGPVEGDVRIDPQSVQNRAYSAAIVQSSANRKDKVYDVNIISNGDPLEIYTDNDGEVIFKKYSPIGELSSFATQYAEVLSKIGGYPVVVCDRDHVISVAGIPKKELLERRVSPALEEVMEQRKTFSVTGDGKKLQPVEGVDRFALVAAPITASGDVCGSIMFIVGDSPAAATDTENKLVQVGASFLGRQMEE